ncbi:Transcriptional regulator, AlpA family [Burkholderia cepacia]|uniref:helix-turn-helix transcriptional regulator n=1 Tax=Burkholderia cepacia TaxID=292 RepID=UPI001CAB03F4|nr:pyocin activator PrtN family protein [Burkholderia cepacia]CAG9247041.1 Transcriptional regulator, AlpA family [Burkholderia cepacia]
MKSLFILMAQFDSKLRLSLDEVCEAIGYAKQTAYNELSLGQFPIPMQKCANKWVADIRDVAQFLDDERSAARVKFDELRASLSSVPFR